MISLKMDSRTVSFSRSFLFFLLLTTIASPQSGNEKALAVSGAAISVTIGGDFIITGTFPAMVNERVDQFVTRISAEAVKT